MFVEKGGEIIPKITGIDINNRGFKQDEIPFPVNCPDCETELIKLESEANFFCPNTNSCRPQGIGRIQHFASRKAMNIDGLGDETITLLYDKGHTAVKSLDQSLSSNDIEKAKTSTPIITI